MGVGNLAALVLRMVIGGLMTGHGAQKLFGWWGGYGLDGTSAWLESMGLRPGRPWAIMAGGSGVGGGGVSLFGGLQPLLPPGGFRAMGLAAGKGPRGQPILGGREGGG